MPPRPPRAVTRTPRSGSPQLRPDSVHRRKTRAESWAHPKPGDDAWRARQQAGISALMGIATQLTLGVGESATAPVAPVWPPVTRDARQHVSDQPPLLVSPESRGGLRDRLAQFRTDLLVRNSLYLMLSTGVQAAIGFIFWVLMARLFTAADVGRASSLIAASALIAFFALLGLNNTLVRFIPAASDVSALITAAFLTVAGCATIGSLAYVYLTPIVAPPLDFIAHEPALAIGFVLLSAAVTLNLLTDSVFIAFRRAGYTALTDGVIGSTSKIVLGVILAGSGAYGLFAASVGGVAIAALVSVVLIMVTFHWRPSIRNPLRTLRPLLKFTGGNYAANAFNILPVVLIPLIVLDRIGAEPSAYYYVAYQMAYLLYAAVYAVESAFFAEGSQADADWRAIRRRSRHLAITLFVPGSIVMALGAHWILLLFGEKYSEYGTVSLELMALAVIPIAIYNWAATVLRLLGQLRALVFCNAVYSVGICGSAWVLASHGLSAMSASWPAGSAAAAVVTTLAAGYASRKARARHRKAKPSEYAVPGAPAQHPVPRGHPAPSSLLRKVRSPGGTSRY